VQLRTEAKKKEVIQGPMPVPGPSAGMSRKLALAVFLVLILGLLVPQEAAAAASSLNQVVTNLRVWLVGLLAALATLLLTIGGVRYLLAGGDPGELERAKGTIKAALIGYALAVLAPVLVTVAQHIVG
jgi:Type IV secretion system pilin